MKYIIQIKDLAVASLWFTSLVVVNFIFVESTQFVWIYAVPVIMITWKYNLKWGLLVSAAGAFSTILPGVMTGSYNIYNDLAEDGLIFFAKLSAITLGLYLGKKTHYKIEEKR